MSKKPSTRPELFCFAKIAKSKEHRSISPFPDNSMAYIHSDKNLLRE